MGSQDFFHDFSMALYHKWDVKHDFAYLLQFFSLISDCLGSVWGLVSPKKSCGYVPVNRDMLQFAYF